VSQALESAFGEPAIFVYANGLNVAGLPVEAAGGVSGTGWDWRPAERDVALFDAILSELEQQFCIDTSRVLSFGRSHGAFFANALACARGDVLKKTAVVSGGFPGTVVGDACAASSMPIWIAHNSGDSVVNVSFAQQARDHWVARNGCDNTTTNVPPAPCGAFEGCASAGVTYCEATANSHDPPPFALEAAGIFLASP
jgi:polyhydroxybutyrate depolymerase